MKNLELELQVAPMSNDTMEYLNVLFGVFCDVPAESHPFSRLSSW